MAKNNYFAPSNEYIIQFKNGDKRTIDIGDECDWGNVQPCIPTDCEDWKDSVGYGNDSDGHIKIVKVIDCDSNKIWSGNKEVKSWYKSRVACLAETYSA